MKQSPTQRPKIAILTAGIAAFLTSLAPAAVYTWDGNGATAPNPNGGTGTWDVNTSLNWWDGAGNVVWPALGGLDDDAIFANTAGTVSLAAGGVTANDLTFDTTGYIVQSNTLTLNGTTPTITTAPGVTATISSVIAGSAGLIKAGTGTLTLSGINTYTGGTTVSAGTLKLDLTSRLSGNVNVGSFAIASTGTLELFNTNTAIDNPSGLLTGPSAFTGSGVINKTGAGYLDFWNNGGGAPTSIKNFTGTINVQGGTLASNGGDWNTSTCSMTLNLSPGTTFDVRTGSVYVDQLNGSGTITSSFNSANALFVGTAGGSSTFGGVMQNGSAVRPLTKLGAGTFTLTGANTYTGTTTISDGILQIGNGSTTGTLGTGPVTITAPGNLTFNRNNAFTVANAIGGSGSLTQVGTGTTTLTGASSYTGATTVSSGGLLLNLGTLSTSSAVSVASGTTFGGRGSAGAVTVNGGTIQGGVADVGSLSLTSLTFNGNSALTLMPVTGSTASVAVSGTVITSGTQTLNIANSAPLASGSYRLVSYSSLGGTGIGAFVLGTTPFQPPTFRARSYTLDTTTSPGTYVALTVFADAPIWTGGNNGSWDTTTTGNWKLASDNTTPTTFFPGDAVQFNDPTGTRNITISGTNVSPGTVAFNNSAGNDYTLTGTSGIAGTASLTKAGAGKVTIANTNTYTGGTTISAGTLELGNGTTNGVIAGTIANAANLTFRNGTAQTHTGVISGVGALVKTGAPALTLSGSSNYSGSTTVTGGGILISATLAPNGTNSPIGNGTSVVLDGGTLRYSGGNSGSDTLSAQFNRAITVGSGGGAIDVAGTGFLFSNSVLTGSGNLSILDTSGDVNNRQVLYTGNSPAFTGTITIGNGSANSGWLQYRSAAVAPFGTATLTVNTGGIYSTDKSGALTPVQIPNNFILNGGKLVTQNAPFILNGTVTVNAGTSFLQADNTSNMVLNGSLIGAGTLAESTSAGTASVELRGDNTAFTGVYNHTGAGATIFFTAASANAAATWNIPSGANANARFAAGGVDGTYKLGALSGTTGRVENFSAAAGNSIFEVGALNTSTTFAGIFANGAGGTVALTKVGTGTLTLSGLSTNTGPTTVSNGVLLLNGGALSTAGAVTVAPGTTFGGKGTAGSTTVAAGATLQGGIANAGSLGLSSLVFGGNATLSLMPVTGTTASVAVTGNVTTSGTQTINITSSFPLPGGNYRLVSYTTIDGAGIGAFALGSLPPSVPGSRLRTYALDTTTAPASYVGLTVVSDTPIWTGTNNGNWDTVTTNNWVLASDGITPTTYFVADAVQFNDTPGNRNIIISGADVAPSGVVFNNSVGNDYTVTGTNGITGGTLLQKAGAGTLTLATTNTYTGDTTVSGGTLQLGNGTTNGAIAGNIINTASVKFNSVTNQTYAGNMTGALGTLTKVGPGTLTLTGANTYSGGTTITEGTLQIGNGTVNGAIGTGIYSVAAGSTLFLNYATAAAATWANITGAGKIELNSAQAINGSANWNPVAMSLPIGFTGTLQVDRGRVHGTPNNFGGTTTIAIGNGAQFLAFDGAVAGTPYTFTQNFTIAGMGWGEAGYEFGALRNSGMNATFTGSVTLTGNSGLFNQGGSNATSTYTGIISDGGAGFSLAINAQSNSITLSNPANSYGGNTTVDQGTLKLGAANVIPDGAGKGNVAVTSTFDLNTFSETVNGLSGAGIVDTVAGGFPTLTVGNNNATSTFSGIIRNTAGTLGLIKTGNGTLTLTGVNTYTGTTTVTAGTLLVNGSISGSSVGVLSGGTLGGSGSVGGTAVAVGGTLAPGSTGPSIGTLNFPGLVLSGTSAFEINKTGVTLTSDLANVAGPLTLGGILNVTASGDTLLPGDTFNLFDAATFSGSFAAVNLPTLSDVSYSWDTSSLGTAGTLTVVPEPIAAVSLFGGLGLLLSLRRRRPTTAA
jgi:autotransporter-associated beta strand protein